MFTGIVQGLGVISDIIASGDGAKIKVKSENFSLEGVQIGDSIACNGVCLTVVELFDQGFWADMSHETMDCTIFKNARRGLKLNLEQALTPLSHLGGHIVQGHVDGVGIIDSVIKKDNVMDVWIIAPNNIAKYIAKKGSITVDGISLTVNDVVNSSFRLTLIPHTHAITTSDDWVKGQEVNLEVDVLARYLERLVETKDNPQNNKVNNLSKELLMQNGFLSM